MVEFKTVLGVRIQALKAATELKPPNQAKKVNEINKVCCGAHGC